MRRISVLLLLKVLVLSLPARADHQPWEDEDKSYDQARRAVQSGQALSLPQMIKRLEQIAPGEIVSVEYEYEFDRWVYEFKIIDPAGSLQTVHLDAGSGALVQIADE